ncbi:hypothetical protein HDU93_006256 [Gonapodya sp. JEL0774]|nr:hypothetical protein HDU93_006256 [Gonapodya sp. JEL0774]
MEAIFGVIAEAEVQQEIQEERRERTRRRRSLSRRRSNEQQQRSTHHQSHPDGSDKVYGGSKTPDDAGPPDDVILPIEDPAVDDEVENLREKPSSNKAKPFSHKVKAMVDSGMEGVHSASEENPGQQGESDTGVYTDSHESDGDETSSFNPTGGFGPSYGHPFFAAPTMTSITGSHSPDGPGHVGFSGEAHGHHHGSHLGLAPKSPREIQIEERAKRLPLWRRDIRTFMRDHKSSRLAHIFHWIFVAAVIASSITMCLATIPSVAASSTAHATIFFIELFCGIIFSIEIVLELLAMASPWELISWTFVIDVCATVPIWAELIYTLSIGSLAAYESIPIVDDCGAELMFAALVESSNGILALVYALFILVTFFATLLYYAEQTGEYSKEGLFYYHEDDSLSSFNSIPQTFWFVLVTLTTIGYGDVTPKTSLGKFVASVAILCSLFVIAFPLTMITFQFSHILRRWEANNHAKQLRRKHMKAAAKEARRKLRESGLDPTTRRKRRIADFVEKVEHAVEHAVEKVEHVVENAQHVVEHALHIDHASTDHVDQSKDESLLAGMKTSSSNVKETIGVEPDVDDTVPFGKRISDQTLNPGEGGMNELQGEHSMPIPSLEHDDSMRETAVDALAETQDTSQDTTADAAPAGVPHRVSSARGKLRALALFRAAGTRGAPLPTTSAGDSVDNPISSIANSPPQLTSPRSGITPSHASDGIKSLVPHIPHIQLFPDAPKENSAADLATPTIADELLRPSLLDTYPGLDAHAHPYLHTRHLSLVGFEHPQGTEGAGEPSVDEARSARSFRNHHNHDTRHLPTSGRGITNLPTPPMDLILADPIMAVRQGHPSSPAQDLAQYNLPAQIPLPQLVTQLGSHIPKHVELKVCGELSFIPLEVANVSLAVLAYVEDFEHWYTGDDDMLNVKIAVRDQHQFLTLLRILMQYQVLD